MGKHYNNKRHDDYVCDVKFRLSQSDFDFVRDYCSLYNFSISEYFRRLVKSHKSKIENEKG